MEFQLKLLCFAALILSVLSETNNVQYSEVSYPEGSQYLLISPTRQSELITESATAQQDTESNMEYSVEQLDIQSKAESEEAQQQTESTEENEQSEFKTEPIEIKQQFNSKTTAIQKQSASKTDTTASQQQNKSITETSATKQQSDLKTEASATKQQSDSKTKSTEVHRKNESDISQLHRESKMELETLQKQHKTKSDTKTSQLYESVKSQQNNNLEHSVFLNNGTHHRNSSQSVKDQQPQNTFERDTNVTFLEKKDNVSNLSSPAVTTLNMQKLISDLEKAIIVGTEFEDPQHNLTNNVANNTDDNNFILQPNILVIIADDIGWNDVSYHGSDQIMTPNIDVLQFHGATIQQYYTDTCGTASRSAFFTGKYPSRMGTQGPSILAYEDRGVPVEEKFLSSYLKDLGYYTHMIGKWDLGKSREYYWPTNRGFDSFFGFLDSSVDYYTYNHVENWNNSEFCGLDLHQNMTPAEDSKGHLTDVLTDHAVQLIRDHNNSKPLYIQLSHAAPHAGGGLVNLQPPADAIEPNDYIAHSPRRLFASMTTSLDRSIGNIVAALAEVGILENTVIVFASDNGAAPVGRTQNFGSNLPLRGLKGTPWEGGVRSAALIWHAELKSSIWDGLFHVTDWLPTLVAAAGGRVTTSIDGVNQWNAIIQGLPSNRKDVLITVDDLNGFAAIREGDFKYIIGDVNKEQSEFFGKNFDRLRFNPPSYEAALLECETARVFKETLFMDLDLTNVSIKRNETTLKKLSKLINIELCVPTRDKGCLFNVKKDPEEINDLSQNATELIKRLNLKLRTLWAELKPRRQPIPDDRSNPRHHNFVWTHWLKNNEPLPEPLKIHPEFPQKVSQAELQYLLDLNLEAFKKRILDCIQNMGDSFVRSIGGLFNFN